MKEVYYLVEQHTKRDGWIAFPPSSKGLKAARSLKKKLETEFLFKQGTFRIVRITRIEEVVS